MTVNLIPGRDVPDPELKPSVPAPAPTQTPPVSTTDAGTTTTTSTNDYVDTPVGPNVSMPAGAELWKVGEDAYFVWFVPTPDGGSFPIAYLVPEAVDLNSFFPIGAGVKFQRFYDEAGFAATGALHMGSTDEIPDMETVNPFETFLEDYEAELLVFPWLADPEVLAIHAAALLEGTTPTDAQLMITEWWRTHNELERAWLLMAASDPAEAASSITDAEITTRDTMVAAGIYNPPAELVNWVAMKFITGEWTQTVTNEQIRVLADPYLKSELDGELATFVTSMQLDTTMGEEDTVRSLVATWLGPLYGNWADANITEWASRIRNDPDAQQQLVELLKGQRLATFSSFTNPELTYDDIAGPMRQFSTGVWGQALDETDPFFSKLVNMNDFEAAGTLLRQKGLEQGIGKVVSDAHEALNRAVGPSVRPL